MKFEHLQGSIVAMVTPFRQDGSVNFDMLTELLERQIAAGTDGILTLGTTGEYSTMSMRRMPLWWSTPSGWWTAGCR